MSLSKGDGRCCLPPRSQRWGTPEVQTECPCRGTRPSPTGQYRRGGDVVAHGDVDTKSLREDILETLPFRVDLMIRPAEEIRDLVREEPFGHDGPENDTKRFASILGEAPRTLPPLPIDSPIGPEWDVRVFRVEGPYALSLRRGRGRGVVYPNEVVEENLGVPATTRGWNTIVRVHRLLEED